MRRDLSIPIVGFSVSAVLAVTYLLGVLICVLAALLIPGSGMTASSGMMAGALQTIPGFGWSVVGFLIGLGWAVIVGFYIAIIFVPVYNYLQHREEHRETPITRVPVSAAR